MLHFKWDGFLLSVETDLGITVTTIRPVLTAVSLDGSVLRSLFQRYSSNFLHIVNLLLHYGNLQTRKHTYEYIIYGSTRSALVL